MLAKRDEFPHTISTRVNRGSEGGGLTCLFSKIGKK